MTRHTILKRTRISRDPSRLPGIARPLWHEPSNCVIIFSPIFYFFLVTRGQMVFFSPPNNRKKMTLIQIFFYIQLVQKMLYLLHTISVLNTNCTVIFYAMRRTKLDSTCVYFDDVLHQQQLKCKFEFDIIKGVASIYIYI